MREMMLAAKPNVEEIINKICDDLGLALKLLDGAFSAIHSSDTSPEHCDKTQERIDKANFQMWLMEVSITPKNALYGMSRCRSVG